MEEREIIPPPIKPSQSRAATEAIQSRAFRSRRILTPDESGCRGVLGLHRDRAPHESSVAASSALILGEVCR